MIALYWPSTDLKPTGGPSGYLYNLRLAIKPNSGVNFVAKEDDIIAERKKYPDWVHDLYLGEKYSSLHKMRRPLDKELFKYDAIHFHSTEDLYLARGDLESFKGDVLLTSHTPCAPHIEKIEAVPLWVRKLFRNRFDGLKKIDEFAFKRADRIIFPCEEAEEPYFHTWQEYSQIRRQEKISYIPSGVKPCSAKTDKHEVRKMYDIPEDAFLVSFVGRHNKIKGYDILKMAASSYLRTNKDCYVIVAGKEQPLKRLDHEHWIEVGWTSDPHSLIAASDLFILPNRETYFDLVLLEVLSLGVPIVCSKTGGNNYVLGLQSKGLIGYDDKAELVSKIDFVANLSTADREVMGIENKNLFLDFFTNNKLSERLIDLYKTYGYIREK